MENWIAFFFFMLIISAKASLHVYQNESFKEELNGRYFQGGTEVLYASSFIRFDVTFVRTAESAGKQNPMQSATGLVEAIVLEEKDRDKIGSTTDPLLCCTPELADSASCNLGEVIIRRDPTDPEWPRKINTFFAGNKTEANMSPETVVLNKPGVYYVYFMICDPALSGTIIRGKTVWKTPFGYLPAKVAPLRQFFGFMSLFYLFLGLVWFLLLGKHIGGTSQIHWHMGLVITLGMCEMATQCFEYAALNSTGRRPVELALWAVSFSSIKRTVSRILLLVVSLGFKTNLCGKALLLGLGVVYFAASSALEIFEHLGNFPGRSLLLLVVSLDSCFILLIFLSLARNLKKLQIERNVAKLQLYRNITNAFAIYVLLSTGLIGFELYFYATKSMRTWIIPAGWNLLYYGLLAIQCVIWGTQVVEDCVTGN